MTIPEQYLVIGIAIVLFVIIRGIHDANRKYEYQRTPFWCRPLLFASAIVIASVALFAWFHAHGIGIKIDAGLYEGYEIFMAILSVVMKVFSFLIVFSMILLFIMTLLAPSDELPF